MNNFTLSINDKEVKHDYDTVRVARFMSLFRPMLTMFCFAFIIALIVDYKSGDIKMMSNYSWFIPIIL
jgi:hypothetical protein